MLDWLQEIYSGEHLWMLQVFVIVLVTGAAHLILRIALGRLARRLEKTRNNWDDAMAHAAQKPLLLFVWVMGLRIVVELVAEIAELRIFEFAPTVHRIAIIGLLMMFFLRFIKNGEDNLMQRRREQVVETDEITIRVVARLLRLTVMITSALIVLQTLNISISGVLAFGGVGGIAVGFAAKDLLANFFGGLMIYMDRPFRVGDWVRSPDREIEGTVEDIGWRLTIIRTFDKRPLYIPNATFTTIALENPSRMSNRRIYETIGLRYGDAQLIRPVVSDVKQMLESHDDIDTNTTLIVNFNGMNASSLDFFIYCFTKTTNWIEFHAVKEDVLLKIIDIIHGHGADIAFPTRTLDGLDVLLPDKSDDEDGRAARDKPSGDRDKPANKGEDDDAESAE